ncbi:hypothetical protein JMJ77_0005800, partial [Colletotrichum scovillei]
TSLKGGFTISTQPQGIQSLEHHLQPSGGNYKPSISVQGQHQLEATIILHTLNQIIVFIRDAFYLKNSAASNLAM